MFAVPLCLWLFLSWIAALARLLVSARCLFVYLFACLFVCLWMFFQALAPKFFKTKRWRLNTAEIVSRASTSAQAEEAAVDGASVPTAAQLSLADEVAAMRTQVRVCMRERVHVHVRVYTLGPLQ